jgi:hypothetical protein
VVGTGPFATSVPGTPKAPTVPTTPATPTPTAKPTTPSGQPITTSLSIAGGKTILYGGSATLTGTLKTSSGSGVGAKTVALQARKPGSASWANVSNSTTSSNGEWSVSVKPTSNLEYRVVFAGATPHTASTSPTTKVLVAPKVTAKQSAKKVQLRKKVIFTGKIRPAHKASTVELQRLQGRKWVTKKKAKTTSKSTFRIVWKTDSTKDYYWRVRIPAHADHAASYSSARKLIVK